MTTCRMAEGRVRARMRTPTIDPSMIPMTDGTTSIGSTAPLFR